jgi:branched-chain amino acid transport system permease protein
MRNLVGSPLGRAIIATRDDAPAASAAGISVTGVRLTVFAIGSAFAAMAGWMDAFYFRNIGPQLMGADQTFKWLLIILIGGIGSLPGVIVSSVLVSLGPELLGVAAGQQVLALGVLMILVVLFAPRGIGGLIDDAYRQSIRRRLA